MERFREIEIVYNIIRFDNKFAFSRPLPTPNPVQGQGKGLQINFPWVVIGLRVIV